MWMERAQRYCPDVRSAPPASELAISDAEVALGVAFPDDLRTLLAQTDGLADEFGSGILPVARIVEINLEMRSRFDSGDLYMPFANLLLIADAGNGDLFGYAIQGDGHIHRPDLFRWDHESDSRQWVRGSLAEFVDGWFSGELSE